MMTKKQNRKPRRNRGKADDSPAAQKRRLRSRTPSLIFIGMLVLLAVVVALASVLGEEKPDCPPGQVWSDDHNHCH